MHFAKFWKAYWARSLYRLLGIGYYPLYDASIVNLVFHQPLPLKISVTFWEYMFYCIKKRSQIMNITVYVYSSSPSIKTYHQYYTYITPLILQAINSPPPPPQLCTYSGSQIGVYNERKYCVCECKDGKGGKGVSPLFHSHQKSNRKKKNTHIKFDRKYISSCTL